MDQLILFFKLHMFSCSLKNIYINSEILNGLEGRRNFCKPRDQKLMLFFSPFFTMVTYLGNFTNIFEKVRCAFNFSN